MGLFENIKRDAKKSGQNKSKLIYFKEGTKIRVRFLQDMDDGLEVVFHDSFEQGINTPCQEIFGRECPYCNDDSLRTRSQYVWSVWNYETKEVQLFMFPVNNCSPIPALIAMYENYGTLTDRDYVISVTGKQQNKTFSVVPMDKVKFRNTKAKPFSKKALLEILDKAYPCEDVEDEDDEDDAPRKKKRPAKSSGKGKSRRPEPEDDEDEDDYDEDMEGEEEEPDEDEGEAPDYSDMTAKELYNLCKKRKIDVPPKKSEKFYIKQLEEYDEAHDDWGDDEDEDDWEDEE